MEKLTDKQLEKIYGRRITGEGVVILDEPYELGYRCPRGHKGEAITWSEFNRHIWCYKCRLDYLSDICPIQRPSWQDKKDFERDIAKLPFRPRIIKGVDRTLDKLELAPQEKPPGGKDGTE